MHVRMFSPHAAPSGYPLQVAGSSTSPTTILLTWSPPSMSDHNGVLTGYVIQATEIDTQLTIQHATSVANNFTISSLNPFSNYLCTVAAKTSVGLGPFSPGEVIQTQQSGMQINYIFMFIVKLHICVFQYST